jgi:hypothetical protein
MKETNKANSDTVLFTVCNIAYLHKALVLADSVSEHTGFKLNIFLFDKKQDLQLKQDNLSIHWMEDLDVPNFLHLAFRYDIIELSTALKPHITITLLEKFEKVVFFDPDIMLFSNIEPIINDLEQSSILLTPHYTTPQSDEISESDTGMMRFGSFNLGFYAVKKSNQSLAFLNWWSRRCIDLCFMESQFGLSTDQKWVSIAPCFFEDIKISFNLGYNVAPWNSWERNLVKNKEGFYIVNNQFPLVFFHFSNFDINDPGYLNKRSFYEKGKFREDYNEIGSLYKLLHQNKLYENSNLNNIVYYYNFFSDGTYINPLLRLAYSSMYDNLKNLNNPFDSKSDVFIFAKKNYLLGRNNNPIGYKNNVLNNFNKYGTELKVINSVLKFILFLLGANRFYLLTKGFVLLSSPRLNKNLWKL